MSKEKLLDRIEEIKTHLFTFDTKMHSKHGTVAGIFASYALSRDENGSINRRGFLNENLTYCRRPIPLLYEHDYNMVIGFVTDIWELQTGLFVRADFLSTRDAQKIRSLTLMGSVSQFSFGFLEYEAEDTMLPDGSMARATLEAELLEISLTETPAQPRSVVIDVT